MLDINGKNKEIKVKMEEQRKKTEDNNEPEEMRNRKVENKVMFQ